MISTASDRFVEALARLNRYTQSAPPRRVKPPLSIALSRQAGSRGAEVARAVGERLGWPVYDQELLRRIAAEKGLQARLLEMLDERHMSWLEEMAASFCLCEASHEGSYLRSLLQLFAALGEAGHCIIVGRGSPQVLPAASTLRVRIIAARADRIAEIERRRQLSWAEAEKWVDRSDGERKQFVQHYFRTDPNDPLGYDLVLNTSKLSVSTCADLIVQAARAADDAVA
jgi:cytidylate kinase